MCGLSTFVQPPSDKACVRALIRVLLFMLAGCIVPATACGAEGVELCRIRVHNSAQGPVQVSCDGGKSYTTVGRVIRPATGAVNGFPAAAYTPAGKVAATAVHGIRVKVGRKDKGADSAQPPLTFSIVSEEFAKTPKGFGGHVPGKSGIYTDIPAGKSIFREFAPFVGNQVLLQDASRRLSPIPSGYSPMPGDVLVIVVERPARCPEEIVFENRTGGAVTARYADGAVEKIAEVIHPVGGVGRYDGTSYTGPGAINTNHGGVLTISTAPIARGLLQEGDGPERRGGFMIQPSKHAATQGTAPPQVMVIRPPQLGGEPLEGKPPLFCGCISLAYDPVNERNSYIAQVRIDDGEWRNMPVIVGKADDAFGSEYLNRIFAGDGDRSKVHTGVTAIRIRFPVYDQAYLAARLKASARRYATASGKSQIVSGVLTVNARLINHDRVMFVAFYIDGDLRCMSNSQPFQYDWDTTTVPDGEHEIEVRALDSAGGVISKTVSRVIVSNGTGSAESE